MDCPKFFPKIFLACYTVLESPYRLKLLLNRIVKVEAEVRRNFNTATFQEQHPRSHHKGATDTNATVREQHPRSQHKGAEATDANGPYTSFKKLERLNRASAPASESACTDSDGHSAGELNHDH